MTATSDPARPLRVLVVDADERVRASLTGLLAIGRRCIVVGSAGHPESALAQIAEEPPDVVVVDPRLPDVAEGQAFIARVHELAPGVRILVMGWGDAHEGAAIARNADGFVRKTYRPRELVDAVMAAARRAVS